MAWNSSAESVSSGQNRLDTDQRLGWSGQQDLNLRQPTDITQEGSDKWGWLLGKTQLKLRCAVPTAGRPFDRQHNKILVERERSCDESIPAGKASNNGLEIIFDETGGRRRGSPMPRVM
jgi:hypothetical protein